jgi:hypothetical protein
LTCSLDSWLTSTECSNPRMHRLDGHFLTRASLARKTARPSMFTKGVWHAKAVKNCLNQLSLHSLQTDPPCGVRTSLPRSAAHVTCVAATAKALGSCAAARREDGAHPRGNDVHLDRSCECQRHFRVQRSQGRTQLELDGCQRAGEELACLPCRSLPSPHDGASSDPNCGC